MLLEFAVGFPLDATGKDARPASRKPEGHGATNPGRAGDDSNLVEEFGHGWVAHESSLLAARDRQHAGSWTELRSYVLEGFDDTAQFRESLQAADVRISRVGFSVDVVAEHVPVIGTHRNFVILAVGAPAPRFLRQQRADHAQHIGTAMKMVSFIERAIGFAHDLAEMHKMDVRRELSNHSEQIVISPSAV